MFEETIRYKYMLKQTKENYCYLEGSESPNDMPCLSGLLDKYT